MGAAAAVHSILADNAAVATCLACHAPGLGAQAGKGNAAPISLRDIVHPVHMGSKIFSVEYLGDCLTCHSVSGDGTFEVISLDGSASGHPLPLTGGHSGVTCAQCHCPTGAEIIPATNLPLPSSPTACPVMETITKA